METRVAFRKGCVEKRISVFAGELDFIDSFLGQNNKLLIWYTTLLQAWCTNCLELFQE